MNRDELTALIKSRGYWKVEITPLEYNPSLIPEKGALVEIINNARVQIRGWDYPHVSHWNNPRQPTPSVGQNFIEGGSDFGSQKEFWRFYQSGQFVHLFAMEEDWYAEDPWYNTDRRYAAVASGDALNTITTIYSLSEILSFLERLTRSGIYENGVKLSISLNGTEGRGLTVIASGRVPLMAHYRSNEPVITFEKTLSKEEILKDYKKIAVEAVVFIFEIFNWLNMPKQSFERDQENFFNKRFQ